MRSLTNKQVSIYIIVVTYQGEPFISKCLQSIKSSTINVQTIVIDNASSDKTVQIIEEDFPNVRLIKNKKNEGFGKANNIGLKIVLKEKPNYLFLLNQDATIFPNTIETLLDSHIKNPEYGILSPIHLAGTQKELDYNFSIYISPSKCPKILSDAIIGSLKSIYPCPFINAAAWFMPLATLIKVGLFDPLFFHYGEDNDYISRFRQHGGKFGLITSTSIVHDRPQNKTISEFDFNRRLVNNFLKIKDCNLSFNATVSSFVFLAIKNLIALFVLMRFKRFIFSFRLFWKTTFLLPQIKKSRNESLKQSAFIDYN